MTSGVSSGIPFLLLEIHFLVICSLGDQNIAISVLQILKAVLFALSQ